nr:MAG TPA: hypothetical protein [Bacteriophage sp.]
MSSRRRRIRSAPKSLNNRLVKQGITNQGALYLTSDYMKAVFGK